MTRLFKYFAFVAATVFGAVAFLLPERVLAPVALSLVRNDGPVPADAIIVLLGDANRDRVRTALELYRQGFAPRVVFGNGSFRRFPSSPPFSLEEFFIPGGDSYRVYFEDAGLSPGQFVVVDLGHATDTVTELEAIRDHALREGWRRVLLVTSPTHSARVGRIWDRIAKKVPGRTIPFDEPALDRWWKSPELTQQVVYEAGAWCKDAVRVPFGL